MVAVAYRSWLFARGSNCKALTGKILVFGLAVAYRRWSLTGGGRLREVVAHGCSTAAIYVVQKHHAGAGPHHRYPVPQAHE